MAATTISRRPNTISKRTRPRARSSDRLSQKAGHETYKAGQVETIHALDWIKDAIGEEGLAARVKNSLKGLKIANYYGCMYTRPRHIFPEKDQGPGSESTSQPHFMDDLLAAAGADQCRLPAEDGLLRRRPFAVRQRHVDQAGAQHHPGRRSCGGGGHRHRMPHLPFRPRDASDPRRKAPRREDQCEDHVLHPASGPGDSGSRPRKVGLDENISDALSLHAKEKQLA